MITQRYLLFAFLMSICINVHAQEFINHVVKRGETISSISKTYGIPEAKILELNPKAVQFIFVGMELRLPMSSTKDLKSEQGDKANVEPEVSRNNKSTEEASSTRRLSHANVREKYEVISTTRLNVRSKPDAKSSVIGSLYPNDVIDILSITDSWAKIEYKGRMAYVSFKYIKKIEVKEDVAEYEVHEKESISEISQMDEASQPEIQNVTVDNDNSLLKSLLIDFVPSVAGGFSNFVSDKVTPKGRFGLGVDLTFQFIAENSILFIPKDYFMDFSLGYSLKGSAAFPMHYITFKLSPIGYKKDFSEFSLFGKVGCLTGYTTSTIETDQYTFNSNLDFGVLAEMGVEYNGIGIALAYERGLANVCDSNLKLRNSGLFLKLSCRLFNVRDVFNN